MEMWMMHAKLLPERLSSQSRTIQICFELQAQGSRYQRRQVNRRKKHLRKIPRCSKYKFSPTSTIQTIAYSFMNKVLYDLVSVWVIEKWRREIRRTTGHGEPPQVKPLDQSSQGDFKYKDLPAGPWAILSNSEKVAVCLATVRVIGGWRCRVWGTTIGRWEPPKPWIIDNG